MLRKGSDFYKESIKRSWGKESANESGSKLFLILPSNWFPLIRVKWLPLMANSFTVSRMVIAEPEVRATTQSAAHIGRRQLSVVEVDRFFVQMELFYFVHEVFDSEYILVQSLFDDGSRRNSIITVNTKEYHSDVLAESQGCCVGLLLTACELDDVQQVFHNMSLSRIAKLAIRVNSKEIQRMRLHIQLLANDQGLNFEMEERLVMLEASESQYKYKEMLTQLKYLGVA
ncbi:hypothetical protein Tco_0699427 [Tanacetum coccineum]